MSNKKSIFIPFFLLLLLAVGAFIFFNLFSKETFNKVTKIKESKISKKTSGKSPNYKKIKKKISNSFVIKVACVGDSTTFGARIKDRLKDNYPAQLDKKLGKFWEVKNFGLNGATLLSKGNRPYINTDEYNKSIEYNPDIVIIMLGTNDSKAVNWKNKDHFVSDYIKFINNFKNLKSKPDIWIGYPVPAFPFKNMKDSFISGVTISSEVLPLVKEVVKKSKSKFIDFHNPLLGKRDHFADEAHPNKEGAKVMANVALKLLADYYIR